MKDFKDMEQHPSYGMMGFYRAQCGNPQPLFGSSIKHNDIIIMRLQTANYQRGLSEDWYYGDKLIAEVEMSSTQFADMITGMNIGSGVPVTLRHYRDTDGTMLKVEEPPFIARGELHRNEFKSTIEKAHSDTKSLIYDLEEIFNTKKSFTKSDKEMVLSKLRQISMNIGCNQEYQVEQFDRQMQKTVTEAKGEVEAFFTNKVIQIGQQTVAKNPERLLDGIINPVQIESEE